MESTQDGDVEIEKKRLSFLFSLCFSHLQNNVKSNFWLGQKPWGVRRQEQEHACMNIYIFQNQRETKKCEIYSRN